MSGSYKIRHESDPGSERSNRNGHSGKDGMAYGGLAYYDNALYTGPHSYKGSFSGNPNYPDPDTYRRKKSKCLVALIVIGLLLVVGIAVFLGVYFGVMEKTDKVDPVLQTEPGKFQGTLKMNNNWDPKYGDNTTTEFTNLKTDLENQLTSMYQNSALNNDFNKVTVTGFSPGSIVGVYILELKATTVQTQNSVLQITVQAVQDVQADAGSSSDLIKAVNTQEIVIAAVLVTTTLQPPVTTTQAPVTTTQAPVTTTQAPATTTQAPVTTTQAPVTTTQPPATTTHAPITTTQPPDTTTQAPVTTTHPPVTTTQAPATTTQPPDTTTQPPVTTTQPPDTTTQPPVTTTQPPVTTTQPPVTTTQPPVTTTQAPDTTTQPPVTTTQPPVTTTQPPVTTTQPPVTTTQAPDTTTHPPDTTTQPPVTTTQPPDTTTKAPVTTTQPPVTTTQAPTTTAEAPVTSTPPPASTTTTPADENPCVDYSLLEPIAINCISKHGQALIAETTTEGKCRVLLDDVITCVVSDIHTQYNKTCTEKEQHNIIINNKDTIETIVRVNPVLCLPEASCMNIRAITYFIPIICEDQINLLRSSGNCSDFSDALKCYYYHTRIKYTCDLDTFMMTVTNNYTALVTDIGKPDLTCPVDTSRIDSSVKASLCQDPDVMQVIVDMYCPHDLRDFIQASSGDKCMYGHNLVVCIVQQMTSVFNTTCMTDDIYQQMKIYQSQIIGVSDQLNIQSCQGTTPMTTEPMTTTMTMTTTATIVEVKGEFEANLKINATWDPKYEDKNSTEYNDLTEKFRNQTLSMYKNSSLEVEDIIIKEVRQGSVYFIFIIVFKKDAANIDSLTPEIVKEVTKKIIETIQENPSDSFDLIQNTAVAEIAIIQVTEILTECDRVPYIKSIVEKYCDRSQQQLKWAIQPQEQCRIFLQMTGCVMFFTRTCSAKKITRTISSNLNDFVENMPGFDPRICYDEDNVVLPTMMPVTAPVKSCAHPDVLSYILNFDCNYDAIPSHFEQAASTSEQCRFYWQSSACVYDNIKNNPVLQGTCSYDEITDVLQKYEAQIYRVHPMNVNASVCFAYDRDPNKCSSMLYDPDMYGHFRDCFYNIWGIRMNQDVDTSAVTCVLYEESFECVYRFYQQKGLDSCNKAVLEKDVIWMTNSINSVISKRYGQNFTEPDVVQTCIGNSSSDPDFGQSLCQDGVGILTANAECIDRYITAVKTGSLSVCSGLKNVFIPCVMEKIAKIDNCSAADMMASVIKEKDLVLTMSSGYFDISKCDEAVGGDVCTTYNTSIIATAVQCSKTLTATANKANAGHAFCSAYNVFLRCVHIIIEKTTGKPCAKSSLDVWMPYVTDAYTNFTKEDAQACIVTDDNDDDMCHDIKTLEDMALYSQCGVSYIPYFKTSSDCRAIIEPYFKCLSEMFPSCDIKEIARKLMTSTTFTDKLQPGFDVLTCLRDDVLDGDICATYNISIITTAVNCAKTLSTTATRENAGHVFCSAYNVYLGCVQYVIEEKTGKTCTKMSLDMWIPYLVPASTNFTVGDAQACNVTDDGMCPDVRTLEVMATYSVCSLYVQYLKMYPDCRTIIEPYFKCLAEMFPACNVTDLAKTLMMSQDFADKLPSESTLLGCLKGSEDGSDICASFNANLTSALTQCGGATYGFIIGSAPKYAFCSAYNTYVNCIHSLIEENTGKTCKRSSLDTWLPYTISLYINVTSEEVQACNVTEDDVDDDVICNDVITIEEMAYYSSCGGYFSVLTSNPDCGLVVKPYMECLVGLFPSCDAREIAKTLLTSPTFTAQIPQGIDILDCIGGADICQNYTDIVRNITECSVAVSGFKDKETHIELLCRGYDVYISCLEVTIHKMGKGCEERSLRTWIPQYMEKSFNLSASTVMTCNVTYTDPHLWCTDIRTLEMMAMETPCGRDFEMLAVNPNCLSAEKFLNCMEGMFPECDGKTLVQNMLMSPLLRNKIPLHFDPMTCFTEGPPSGRFEVTVKLNETFDDKLPTNNSDERRNFILQFEKEVQDLFKGTGLENETNKIFVTDVRPGSIIVVFEIWLKMGSIYYSTLRAEDLRQQIVQKIKQIQDGPQTKPSYLFSVVVDDIFVKMIVTTDDVTTTTSPTPTIAPDCNSVEYIKQFATMHCDAARNQLTLVQNSKQCSVFLDMVGCIMFNSMKCSAEEVVRTLNRDLWGIIGKNVTGFDSTTCYVSEDNIVFPTIVPETAPLIPCKNPHVLRYILNYNCYYDGLENFMQGNMPLESCRIYWFSSFCVYGYTKDNAMLGNCSYQDITDVLEKYDEELYLVRPVDVNASVCFEYDRKQDKCSTMLYDPTHYALFFDCYSTLLTIRMNPLLNSTGLDCLLYEENLECGFRFYEQIGIGWCDKMQFEKDWIWYTNGLDGIMTKATGTPLGQPDVVERCIANASMAPDFGMYFCRDIKGLILSNVLCIHRLQYTADVCSTLRTGYIPCLKEKADDYKMMCSDAEDFLWNGLIQESDLIKHLTWNYVDISKCNTANKTGTCPPVANHTGGGCVEECSADWQCTGNQKCCSNGCGHTCVDPSPETMSKIFEITFRFDIPWKSEYRNGTGYMMLTTKISDQLNSMVYNSTAKDVVDYIQIIDVRQGSVLVTIVIGFNQYLTPVDVRQTTINLVKAVQEQPPSSSNDLIQKIDLTYLMVSEHRDGPITTTSPPIAGEDCHSVKYIKQFVTSQCDSARNQLTKVENSKRCSVFLDLVGCVVFLSQKCSIDQVMMTLNKDIWGIIGQNITGFDPVTCYGSGTQIVLPTIMPLNTTLKPCIHPDVLNYVLKYDCYYTALEQQMNGDTELESCRFYWSSSSCVYGALKDNAMMGNCSYQEIAQVLQMYENQLYMISPKNVNASVCFDYDRSTELCSTFLYDPYSCHYFYDCYSSGYINRNNLALDVSSVGCMIYEESYECMYRFYKQKGLGSCDRMQFEEDVIWFTNSMNDIMSQSTGTPPDSKDTVKMCIANVSHTPDFGQDLCEDGPGLIMADTVCLIYLQYIPDKCSGIKTTYLPCLLRKTVDYRMACSEDMVYASIMKESDLILNLTMNRVDISKCDQDEDKVGECPSVRNDTVGICLQNCTYDKECTGNQKCCSNGCGHVCVEPVSKVFKMTFRFNITWDSDYGDENSTKCVALTADILYQVNTMVANSQVKDLVEWLKIIGIREGSVYVDFLIGFITELTADDVQQTTVMLVQTVQANSTSPLDKIKSINTDDIHVTIYKDGPITTTSPPIGEDCHSVKYIKQFVTSQCDSARNQLTKVENSKRCSVFLDLVGCVVFLSQKCSIDQVMMTLNKDIWGIIGQNITGFDPVTCYGSGSQIVLPTIMPLNTTLKPCIHPDVLNYVLKYDCYYTALEQQMNGDTELESCRFYWSSSSCVYGALKDNAMMGNCSYQEITQVLQMYENQLYMISPKNVNASVCFDYDRSTELCSTFLYDPYSYFYFYDCYSSGYINRNNWGLDVSSVGCMIYEESYECMYRLYKQKGLGSCDRMQFEEDVIWLTNSMNDIMSQSTGTPPDSKDTVKMCIANVSHTPDFGQDLCEDGPGLIMADTVCLIYLQYIPDKCSGIKTTYLPCLLRKTVDYRMACSEDMVYASIMKESDLILNLTMNRVDISKCDQDEDKVGECPSVRNDTVGICVQNCRYDKECTGNQKCCSTGCGHVCVEPVSKVFKMTFRFNITWDSDYGDENSTKCVALTADILYQVNTMVANSHIKDLVEWLKIIGIREGSVYVDFLIGFITELTADDVQQTTVMLVQTVQANSTSPLDKIKSINTDDIHVTIYKDGPITTTSPPIGEDCHSVKYIKQFVTSQCDSARNQLTKVENSKRCSVFLDLVGCVVFQSQKCSIDQVMMTLNKDIWGIIGQNITGFDPVTCYGSGSQIVLPTIMPLNTTLKPCIHPDVLNYVLKYDCYYTALEQQMNGDTELESCRFYWYSSSCVYGALKDNAMMGNCSYQEIAQVLQMYENQLYMISPKNVNASVCFDYDRSTELCSTFLYDPYSYHYFYDCYSSGYINRNNWALDVSSVGCMIYEESYECMYRLYKQKGLGSCDRMQFEEDVIWLTNSMNDIMSQSTGTPPDSKDTVKMCIANVSHTPDFGQDLCEDGPGLIMADTVCLIYLQYIPDKCSGIKTTYLPCLLRKTVDYRMACSEDMVYASIMKESDLILNLTMNRVDISKCDQDEDKIGECPSVRNDTVGICLQNCTYDKECTGNQKCCSNGCGHVCVEPVSKVFKMTFRFNITWDSDYGDENSTKCVALTADILNQVNKMVANSHVKDLVEWLKIIGIREGSVYVDFLIGFITELTADDVQQTTVMLVQTVQANSTSPLDKIKSINTDDIHVTIYKDLKDVCTDMSKISAEMASCYAYLLYIVSPSNAENCGMYNYYLDCIESKVTENGQRCEGDSLRSLMTTFIPTLQRPELGYILNCPDYTDGICDDRAIIELIFNDKCTPFLPAFTTLPTCKAFETIIDSCMNFVMPGSRCDKSAMLSALSSISVIADKIPQDFNISSCSDPFAPSNCRTYGHGMDKPEVLECMMPFYDVNIDDLPPDVRCRMYDALINCMNVHITTDGVICDVPSLHTWLPDYFGQLKVNPDLLRNCTVGRINSTTFCTDMNILEEFGNYSSCRALLQNFSSNPSCGSATTAFQCFEYILPQCDFMVVIQMMMSSPVFQSYIPPGFNIMACAPANNDTTPSPSGKLKNGTCPKISHGDGSACADECTSDSSCPGDQKCCSDECGLKCMDPEDDTDKDAVDTCFGSWGSCVSTTNCHMVMWSYNTGTDLISFNITAAINPDTWIAIGFNKEAKMVGTDAIVSWITTDGKVTVTDRIITSYVLPPLDADPEQDILDIEGYRKDGLTNIMFRRPLTTANPAKDFQFSSTNCAYFIYAIGGNYNDGDKSITKHSNTPTISTDKICLPCSGDVCTDIATFKQIAVTTCKPQIDQFSSSDNLSVFCQKLNNLDACIKGALPTYGCPNEIATEVYPKLLGLLDQLLGFSASSKAIQCSS